MNKDLALKKLKDLLNRLKLLPSYNPKIKNVEFEKWHYDADCGHVASTFSR